MLYVVSTVLFILALRGLGHESTAKAGTGYGILGMAVAVGGTVGSNMVNEEAYWLLPLAIVPASAFGIAYAYTVETDRLPVSPPPLSPAGRTLHTLRAPMRTPTPTPTPTPTQCRLDLIQEYPIAAKL